MAEPQSYPLSDPKWTDKKALLKQVQRMWDRGLILQEAVEKSELFPRRLVFKTPNSKQLSQQFDAVRHWLGELQKLSGFRIVYKQVHNRIIGENRLPYEIWIDELETAITLLNRQKDWHRFTQIVTLTRQREPQLLNWLKQYPLKALSLAAIWQKLLDFMLWCKEHPKPGIYLRQVSLPGLDSKFIEQHRAVLYPLLNQLLPEQQINTAYHGTRQFEQRFGFKKKPERIRFRLLDTELADCLVACHGQDNDISLTAEDFSLLEQQTEFINRIERVFMTENEINFLSFPLQKNSLIIFGSGYGFDALSRAQWLAQKEIHYWGDIDTHGFAILDQLRSKFPQVRSLLMDVATLKAHETFWGFENKAEKRALSRLDKQEQALYQALLDNKYQKHLRLEQERIYFEYLAKYLPDH